MTDGVSVVLIVFNRPDLAADAISRLSRVRPDRLLVVADGPRDPAEASLCTATRDAVRQGITWPCDVEWDASASNLGCSERVLSGLDWAFTQVDSAIILEDDVEVAEEFFALASDALTAHRDDPQLGAVTARNELVAFPGGDVSLRVRRCGIWGWATWSDRWQAYRSASTSTSMPTLPGSDPALVVRLHRHFETSLQSRLSGVWDIAWTRWLIATGQRTLVPARNLSANHGFRSDGTHTTAAGDFRGAFPVSPGAADPAAARALIDMAGGDAESAYDDLATLLDIMALYDHPRRWRLLASQALSTPSSDLPEGIDIMLEPWRRRDASRAALGYLAGQVDSHQIAALREAFA